MELLKNLEGLSADEQMSAVVELQKAAMKHLEEQKQASIGKSAEMVILGLKKIKSDFEAKFDSLNYDIQTKVASLKDGEQGLQGPKGEQGDRGLDGYQGKDGRDGKDGKDGTDGVNGVSVTDAKIDFDGSLVITLSDGREINVGEVVPVDVAEKIRTVHNIQSGSGGDSQTVLDAIAALQATIATYGTMATQNANNVAITGGTINNTTVGATTPAAGTFTTLTGNSTSQFGRSSANYLQAVGGASTVAPVISAQGSDTNIDLNLTTKGTGAFVVNTGGGTQFRVVNTASAVNYFQANGAATGVQPGFRVDGSDTNISTAFTTKGTGGHFFSTNSFAQTQFVLAHTASAVNYVQVTGAATGSSPIISAQGSDSNTSMLYYSKGFGVHQFRGYGGNNILGQFYPVQASPVNYFQIGASSAGNPVVVMAVGSDTNISAVVQPKGTGALQAQQTDSTATGGNARGANAVDWQTSRFTAANVASGAQSVVGGGYANSSVGTSCFVGGGYNNSVGGFACSIGGGQNNTISSTTIYSSILGGTGNTASGYFNFVGGGSANSGTSASAVTTQSATMNGTTAVTLSGSNASIKVGQYISGTYASGTYVAAVSGTSLTLSSAASGSGTATLSFYTPHGVVVGGGNNQATGSYSFIGGGGDAGTAANRNVASGDWSFVGGGGKNVASGIASFVGGGGFDGTVTNGNIASGSYSIVVGGSGNTASGTGSFIGGGNNNVASASNSAVLNGFQNTANSAMSSSLGGRRGITRGIIGNAVFSACDTPMADANGVSQSSLLILARQTTDATATVLCSNSASANTTNQVILPNNSAYFFTGEVVAGVTGGGNTKGWTIEGVIKRGANAAATTLVGTPTVTSTYADAGASTWAIALSADTTNGGLAVTFTGQASTTIRTVCQIRTTEMTY